MFEEKLLPRLRRIYEGMEDAQERHVSEWLKIDDGAFNERTAEVTDYGTGQLNNVCKKVEAVIKFLGGEYFS